MKFHLLLATLLAASASLATDTPATNATEQTEQTAQAANTNEQNLALGSNTDEIDLEEIDDSAEAAKAPVIKANGPAGDAVTYVDISCDNATLADVLRQFRKVTDANIISDDSTNLQRRVSVNLRRVPWIDGLQSILNSRNYRLEPRGDIFFVKEDKILEPILTRSFPLNHASAKELAELFNSNYGRKDAKGVMVQHVATCFEGANVVVVTATEKTIANCESIIQAVDKAVAQIYIEARFLELSSEAMHKLGLKWNSLESWGISAENVSAEFSMSTARATGDGYTIARTLAGDASASRSSSLSANASSSGGTSSSGSSSSSSSSGSSSFSRSYGRNANNSSTKDHNNNIGFSGQLSADDFSLALSAFESLGEGRIFSNPKVIVSNGKEAKVDMTTKFPNIKLSSQRSAEATNPYIDMSAELTVIPGDQGHKELDYKDKGLFAGSCFYEWGITLSVKPRISPDGLISVEIIPAISQLDKDESSTGFYEVKSDTDFGKFPIIQMKRIITNFTMKDGATAVIGGLTRTVEEDVDTGIPYLRKMPWVGQKVFGWKGRQKVQKEIIVCVTIGIANPADLPKDVGLPTNAVMGREYVRGDKLEPGLREGSAAKALALDLRTIDDEERVNEKPAKKKSDDEPGTVTITPSKLQP